MGIIIILYSTVIGAVFIINFVNVNADAATPASPPQTHPPQETCNCRNANNRSPPQTRRSDRPRT